MQTDLTVTADAARLRKEADFLYKLASAVAEVRTPGTDEMRWANREVTRLADLMAALRERADQLEAGE